MVPQVEVKGFVCYWYVLICESQLVIVLIQMLSRWQALRWWIDKEWRLLTILLNHTPKHRYHVKYQSCQSIRCIAIIISILKLANIGQISGRNPFIYSFCIYYVEMKDICRLLYILGCPASTFEPAVHVSITSGEKLSRKNTLKLFWHKQQINT